MNKPALRILTKVVGSMAFPGFAIAGNKHGSLEMGLLITLVAAPVTLPCMLVFGPIYGYLNEKCDPRVQF